MTLKFASIELARLYETQGHLADALAVYRQLDDNVLKGGAEVRAAVKRLELAILRQEAGEPEGLETDPGAGILSALEELNPETVRLPDPDMGPAALDSEQDGEPDKERIGQLIERWLMLLVVQKRLDLFKKIRSRL